MRTTINLPDALAEAAKTEASARGRTFTSLVEEGLRAVLDRRERSDDEPLPVFQADGGRGMLVDPADKDALAGLLDADGFR